MCNTIESSIPNDRIDLVGRHYIVALLFLGCESASIASEEPRPLAPPSLIEHRSLNPTPSAAYQWLQILLEASGRSVDRVGARPTIISREMAIVMTAVYDAWAAYDDKAVGTRLGGKLRGRSRIARDSPRAADLYRHRRDGRHFSTSWGAITFRRTTSRA